MSAYLSRLSSDVSAWDYSYQAAKITHERCEVEDGFFDCREVITYN